MKIRDYERLIMIHDQKDRLDEAMKILFGEEYILGFEDGVLGSLSYIDEILKDNMAEEFRYDERKDFIQREWYGILCDKSLSAKERAKILCAKQEVEGCKI